jgi:hypothetical protein
MLPRDLARRYGRQTRLADIGETGQAKLCAAKVSPSASGFAGLIEARYLAAAGVDVTRDPAAATTMIGEVPELGLRHAAPREVADGAIRALAAIRAILEGGA